MEELGIFIQEIWTKKREISAFVLGEAPLISEKQLQNLILGCEEWKQKMIKDGRKPFSAKVMVIVSTSMVNGN